MSVLPTGMGSPAAGVGPGAGDPALRPAGEPSARIPGGSDGPSGRGRRSGRPVHARTCHRKVDGAAEGSPPWTEAGRRQPNSPGPHRTRANDLLPSRTTSAHASARSCTARPGVAREPARALGARHSPTHPPGPRRPWASAGTPQRHLRRPAARAGLAARMPPTATRAGYGCALDKGSSSPRRQLVRVARREFG